MTTPSEQSVTFEQLFKQRFLESGRQVLALSQKMAVEQGHTYIDPGHILLALLNQKQSSNALEALGVNVNNLKQETTTALNIGYKSRGERFGLTLRAKKLIELAIEKNKVSGEKITSIDLLIATIRLGEGIPLFVLGKIGINESTIKTLRVVSNYSRLTEYT